MMFCPNCGRELPKGTRYCGICGCEISVAEGPDDDYVKMRNTYAYSGSLDEEKKDNSPKGFSENIQNGDVSQDNKKAAHAADESEQTDSDWAQGEQRSHFSKRSNSKKKRFNILTVVILALTITAGIALVILLSGVNKLSDYEEPGMGISEEKETSKVTEETKGAEETEETEETDDVVYIEVQEIYNADGVIVTADQLTYDDVQLKISLSIENNSSDDITVRIQEGSSVNGYSVDFTLFQKVSAGSTDTGTVFCLIDNLEYAGIDTIAELEFKLYGVNDDNRQVFESELITLSTSAYGYEQIYDDDGEVLYDAEGIRIIYKDYITRDSSNDYMLLYVENNTEQDIRIGQNAVSVNRHMVSGSFFTPDVIYAGNKAIAKVYVSHNDLEENDIAQVEEMMVDFIIYDAFDYSIVINDIGKINVSIKY